MLNFYKILIWPIRPFIWWYSDGLKQLSTYIWRNWIFQWKRFGLGILFRHLHKPMYGLDGRWDVFVSILVRTGHFIVLFVAFLLLTIALAFCFFIYIILPPLAVFNLFWQVTV